MNNGSKLMPYKNICINFKKQIIIDGMSVWAAEYKDYSGETIIIIPDDDYFKPKLGSKYLVQRPKGFEEASAFYENCPVYKKKILEISLVRITENNISIFKSDYYIPQCAIKNSGLSVFLRPAKNKNQFALIWIEEEQTRNRVYDYIKNNIPHSNLQINKSNTITIEGECGENHKEFEKNIINSVNHCLKG